MRGGEGRVHFSHAPPDSFILFIFNSIGSAQIPPEVLKKACGIAIYTSMRSGMAPFGGSGGSGLVMSRLPDGSWSGPSFITPQNASAGLMFGLDVYDVVLLIMSPEALQGFKTHKFTLGAETGVAAGPVGTGASMDLSVNGVDWTKSSADVPEGEKRKMAKPPPPLFSYTRNRGFYGGIEGMAMIYLTRFDENERVYHWPGITGRDVLEGRVHKPPEAKVLYEALAAAESGQAQDTMSDLRVTQHADKTTIAKASSSEEKSSPVSLTREFIMDDGERLELPLTPEKLEEMELQGVKNSRDDERMQADYKAYIWSLPAPPRHPAARTRADGIERTKGGRRFVAPASSRPAPNSSPATEPHKDDAEARDQPQEQVESPSELRTPLSLQGDFKEPPDAGPLPSSSTTTTPLPPPPPYTSDSAAETAPRDTKQALYPEKIPHGTSPPEGSQVGEPQFGPPPSSPQALHRQDLPTATPHQGSCSEGTFTLPEQNFERQATPFPDDKDVRDMKDDKNEKEKDQKDEQDGEDNEGEGEFFDLPLNGMEKVPGHPVPSQDQKAYLPQETGVLA